ncbi:RsmB/NOP family class I SAM-dependent RNA methyltransferase [Pseudolabrys sp. FHR47]|uniref:RsmB/NOP family class I SAM-dependent RNA methyltransferase n=1 Tax=Pseudolabrys sp. FHR47 TaxID=2562284 RepID=UPI0010BEFCCA|nr:RsmB/NOP family class I SAM-dependent RNA methyltransferase [Pseudolabrys sp. FHR47]
MTPAARLQAAIEVVTAIIDERRPAPDALKTWGQAHRFAGSGDRAAIGGLVYDALRRKASSAYVMGADTPRAIVLGMLKRERGLDADAIARLASGAQYAPAALSDDERSRLDTASLDGAPAHVAGDYPEWLDDAFAQSFGDARAEEGAALASRAPLDLRVNTLKADRDKAASMLADLKPEPTPWSPWGLRIALAADAKAPPIHAEPAFLKGLVEVQDEGSQLAALFSGAKPGEQVLDLCAGAGGKTLALAAMMENKGQLFATDDDKRRLAPIHDRLTRSGARNVQVRTPKSVHTEIDDLKGRMDLVLIDAPCTGTGAWRRNPDAKWRMRPGALEQRTKEQADILDRAVSFLKPGGRIVYITCSLLDAENGAQVRGFLARHAGFVAVPGADIVQAAGVPEGFAQAARLSVEGTLLTPRTTGTDGFFVSVLKRS